MCDKSNLANKDPSPEVPKCVLRYSGKTVIHPPWSSLSKEEIAEGACPAVPDLPDNQHCSHWWKVDQPCCNCGDDSPRDTFGGVGMSPEMSGHRGDAGL